jgi:hypothetical protein
MSDLNELKIIEVTALEAQTKAEIDIQIATAKRYPREIKKSIKNVLDLATVDQQTAAGCFYAKPQGGTVIEGPSVRLAEIVASSWGNLRSGSRMISDDGTWITSQGMCHDLETNTAIQIEVKKKVTKKDGVRYSDDMVVTTANAANSVALRNAIFRVIPMAVFSSIMSEIKKVAIGSDTQESVETRAEKAIQYFEKLSVVRERIFAALGKKKISDLDEEDLVKLTGFKTAIKDKEITLEEAFPQTNKESSQNKSSAATKSVVDKLNKD